IGTHLGRLGRLPIVSASLPSDPSISVTGALGAAAGLDDRLLALTTGLCALLVAMALTRIAWRAAPPSWERCARLAVASGLAFTVVFYHTNPEYLALAAPLLALVAARTLDGRRFRLAWTAFAVASTAAYVVNVSYGLAHAEQGSHVQGGKLALLALARRLLPEASLLPLWVLSVVTCSAALLAAVAIFLANPSASHRRSAS
ncbi:MAG: hypothetical protein JSV80_13810, partial [Acidobacteriota bacterium]